MRRSSWTPSVVRNGHDQNVYLVVDDFGRLGRAYCETDVEEADLETVITRLISGQFKDPIRIVAFNTVERWSEDVSEDVAREIQRRAWCKPWRMRWRRMTCRFSRSQSASPSR